MKEQKGMIGGGERKDKRFAYLKDDIPLPLSLLATVRRCCNVALLLFHYIVVIMSLDSLDMCNRLMSCKKMGE